jgi:hypothetical protein
MLKAQAATVCLGVLRGAPRLAEALPPRGYVELLRAVAREHSRGAVVGAVEAAPESEGAFGLDLEHDLPFEVLGGLTTLRASRWHEGCMSMSF